LKQAEVLDSDFALDFHPTSDLRTGPKACGNFRFKYCLVLIVSLKALRHSSVKMRDANSICYRVLFVLTLVSLLDSCQSYGPYHANTASEPLNSVRGPSDGRYKFAFIEFGDQGSAMDMSQRAVALNAIRQAQRPLLFV